MFFGWRCARARMPLLTGFWAAITVGKAQTASNMVPSVDLILESPVKGVLAAANTPFTGDSRMRSTLGTMLLAVCAFPTVIAAQNPVSNGIRALAQRQPKNIEIGRASCRGRGRDRASLH